MTANYSNDKKGTLAMDPQNNPTLQNPFERVIHSLLRSGVNQGHWLMKCLLIVACGAILTPTMTHGQSVQAENIAAEKQSPEQLAQTLADYAYPLVIMKI